MAYLLIRQRFLDYAQWREAFDSLAKQRESLGLQTVLVTRNMGDPDEAVVVFQFDDIDNVRRHFPSPELEEAHRRGGVVDGSTQVAFLSEADAI